MIVSRELRTHLGEQVWDETYRKDLLYALERVGIRLQAIPHLNGSRKSDYRDLYNTRTGDIVAT